MTQDAREIGREKCAVLETEGLDHRSGHPNMPESETFDCFLSHNSRDKEAVRALAKGLRAQGISVWLDEDMLRPGALWQRLLESGIRASRSVAVLVGADGLGPWEDVEMQAALSLAVKDGRPVIPVLLADAPSEPELPLFLSGRIWVDLRPQADSGNLTPLDRLIWGITGEGPGGASQPPKPADRNCDQGRTERAVESLNFLPQFVVIVGIVSVAAYFVSEKWLPDERIGWAPSVDCTPNSLYKLFGWIVGAVVITFIARTLPAWSSGYRRIGSVLLPIFLVLSLALAYRYADDYQEAIYENILESPTGHDPGYEHIVIPMEIAAVNDWSGVPAVDVKAIIENNFRDSSVSACHKLLHFWSWRAFFVCVALSSLICYAVYMAFDLARKPKSRP